MTYNPENLPIADDARLVLFVAYPEVGLLDVTGPQTVFWVATRALQKRGLGGGYVLYTASLAGGIVHTAEGLALQTMKLADFKDAPLHTMIVPGSPEMARVIERSRKLVDWIGAAASGAERVASVCTGAFLLADAGLLDTKRAATHWAMCDQLKQRFPAVEVDHDAIFVEHGKVWSSAGVSAGIDLALAMVEVDCGRDIAMEVARELVVYLKRPGGQSQFSELLQSQTQDSDVFDELNRWIAGRLDEPLPVEVLAREANMSPRNFARMYKQKTGRTPAKAVEVFRLEAAKRLLEDSSRNVDQIARQCGFGDEERMRVTFQRNLGISPRDYRRRFFRN